ncbi:MAG: hypothetical protein M3Z64_01475, partial [Verrucomicrobiota bacterium]|nr:hypothetical protein [Verrucomicrobiota bacterium]
QANSIAVGKSYHNDVSPSVRDMPAWSQADGKTEHEANENPKVPHRHRDSFDPIIQYMQSASSPMAAAAPALAAAIYNFDGIVFPGVGCNCAPPDTNGAVGKTQYVQIVNEGYQVFDKSTGGSVLGPNSISSIWTGFGGGCETLGAGDPVVLYDQLADRWVITQFAKATSSGPITDECVAVSTTGDATGSYYRYGFHLGSNFYDYPHLSVWPDAYYMSMNVFNAAGSSYLGPQPFAFDRAKMLAGAPATFVSPTAPLGSTVDPFLPANLDGPTLPPAGAPATFVGFPGQSSNINYTTYHFHADFVTAANSTFTTFANPPAAAFTSLCPTTRACVPQAGVSSANNLDASGDRLMFRLAYRNFGDHESVVGNYSVNANGVAGVRWFELRNVTAGPVTKYQESTYALGDGVWRWMGSASMDGQGNMAIGFSASSSTLNPQLRYAARMATDPLNTLQGEAHLYDGTGSQSGTGNRWGDYASLTVDPVDDSTFWFTSEYYSTTGTYNWRTRIGSFKVATASPTPTPAPTATPIPTATPSPTASPTPAPDFSLSVSPASVTFGRNGGNASYTVTITPSGGFSGNVSFSVSGQPPGATPTFAPNPATTTTTLTVSVPASTARGTYRLTITGTSAVPALTHTAAATLVKSK